MLHILNTKVSQYHKLKTKVIKQIVNIAQQYPMWTLVV